VGGNLAASRSYDACYRSTDIQGIEGRTFDTLVCAGVRAVKYLANRHPEEDLAGIRKLTASLAKVEARRFILISTVDVFADPRGCDEGTDPSAPNHPYGTHRLELESFVRGRFQDSLIVRLPGLFGPGLKKNVIYDLIHDYALEAINPDSSFQYYDLRRLAGDLDRAGDAGLRLLHLATEPLPTRTLLERCFPGKVVGAAPAPTASYDFRTRHGALWGKQGPYLYEAGEVLADLARFLHEGQP
jgi:hypothetical protein